MAIERIQAPSGGINTDASFDYVPATQAPVLTNLLTGMDGRVAPRGAITSFVLGMSATSSAPDAFWSFDDFALAKGNPGGGTKTWRVNVASSSKTDVTATLVETPLDHRHARYGAYVYGAIDDANAPQLGRWDGLASAIVPQANAPFQWTDLQVFANRLWVLGGTAPGTTTPVVNAGRVLWWSDTPSSSGVFTDLSLTASWQDDVSGLTNQIQYDGDDTPIALAGCGRFMAILGSRSINILTGSGTSSFAIRNLTKSLGCVNRDSVVEVADGFYFASDRGFAFCDGSAVTIVSDPKVSVELTRYLYASGDHFYAAAFNGGYIALCHHALGSTVKNPCWLFNTKTGAWSGITMALGSTVPRAVFRTNTYPILWQSGALRRAELVNIQGIGFDYDDSGNAMFAATNWTTRFVRLASPGLNAVVRRVLLDHKHYSVGSPVEANAWLVQVVDSLGNILASGTAPARASGDYRSRYVLDVNGEADAVQLVITNASTDITAGIASAELYDAWVEYEPANQRGSI